MHLHRSISEVGLFHIKPPREGRQSTGGRKNGNREGGKAQAIESMDVEEWLDLDLMKKQRILKAVFKI